MTFGDLRALLHEPSGHALKWHALLFALEDARAGGWLDEALAYAEDHMRGWPDAVREVPRWWWERLADGELPAGWALARRMVTHGAWEVEAIEGVYATIYLDGLEANLGDRGALAHLTELSIRYDEREVALLEGLPQWTPNLRALQVRSRSGLSGLGALELPALERLEVMAWRVEGLDLSKLPALRELSLPCDARTLEALEGAPPTLRQLRWFNASGELRAALAHPIVGQLGALEVELRDVTDLSSAREPGAARDDDAFEVLASTSEAGCALRVRGITSRLPADVWLDALMQHPTLDLADALAHAEAPPSLELALAMRDHLGAHEGVEAISRLMRAHEIDAQDLRAMLDAGVWRGALRWDFPARGETDELVVALEHLARSPALDTLREMSLGMHGDHRRVVDPLLAVLTSPRAGRLHTLTLGGTLAHADMLDALLRHPATSRLRRVHLRDMRMEDAHLEVLARAPNAARVALDPTTRGLHTRWSLAQLERAAQHDLLHICNGYAEVTERERNMQASWRAMLADHRLDALRELHVNQESWTRFGLLDALSEDGALPHLQALHIDPRWLPEADALTRALGNLPALRRLRVFNVTDELFACWLQAIKDSGLCARLEHLELVSSSFDPSWSAETLREVLLDRTWSRAARQHLATHETLR